MDGGQQKQLGQELIAKIPRDLQERDPLRRAEVWPQEKEHSDTLSRSSLLMALLLAVLGV